MTQQHAREDVRSQLTEMLGDIAAPPEPREFTYPLRAAEVLYSLYKWTALTGVPPTEEDWKGKRGWPQRADVDAAFDSWQRMLNVSGVMESQAVQRLHEIVQLNNGLRSDLDRRVAAIDRREAKLSARADEVNEKGTQLRRQLRTAKKERDDALGERNEARRQARDATQRAEAAERELEQQAGQDSGALAEALAWIHDVGAPSNQLTLQLDAGAAQLAQLCAAWVAQGEHAEQLGWEGPALTVVDRRPEQLQLLRAPGHWELGWRHRYEQLDGGQVRVAVAISERDEHSLLAVRVGLRLPRVGVPEPTLALPRLVREVLDVYEVLDAGHRLHGHPRKVEQPGDVDALVELISSPQRRRPVVVCSTGPDADHTVDPEALARSLAGTAHVWALSEHASFALSDAVGRERSCWGGAVRTYMPGFPLGELREHPLLLSTTLSRQGHRRALDELRGRLAAGTLAADPWPTPRSWDDVVAGEPISGDGDEAAERDAALADVHRVHAELEQARRELDLREQAIKELSAQLARSAGGADADEPGRSSADEPRSVLQAAERAAAQAKALRYAPSALQSAADSPFKRPAAILEALEALDVLAVEHRSPDGIGMGLADRARELGLDFSGGLAPTTLGRNARHYTFTYEGRALTMGPHARVGRGRGAGLTARIYLAVDDAGDVPQLVVGHIGRHLPDSTFSN